MTDSQILKAARKLLPLLEGLLGAKSPAAKKELQRLLAQVAQGSKTAPQRILALLNSYPAVRRWLKDAFPKTGLRFELKLSILRASGARQQSPKSRRHKISGQLFAAECIFLKLDVLSRHKF